MGFRGIWVLHPCLYGWLSWNLIESWGWGEIGREGVELCVSSLSSTKAAPSCFLPFLCPPLGPLSQELPARLPVPSPSLSTSLAPSGVAFSCLASSPLEPHFWAFAHAVSATWGTQPLTLTPVCSPEASRGFPLPQFEAGTSPTHPQSALS